MNARTIRCFVVLLALSLGVPAIAQELVISTYDGVLGGPGPMVVIGDLAHDLPVPVPFYVAPIGPPGYPNDSHGAINPHGLALLSRDKAVGTHAGITGYTHFVDIVDLPTASLDGWFFPGGVNDTSYIGYGSAALAPDGAYLLLASGSTNVDADRVKLFVVPTPLSSTSIASDIIDLPGDFGTAQTHGIVFDPVTLRAYIGHTNGITAIDPPYASANVAFTIPLPPIIDSYHVLSYSVELSPDASTLLAGGGDGTLRIVHAPFQAGSNYQSLMITGAQALGGIAITPDGSQALVVDEFTPQAFAVSAPFSPSSHVETIALDSLSLNGFEDLAISPDGQYAAITGNGAAYIDDPLIVLRAPFTEAGVTAYAVPLIDVGYPYGPAGRGAGTVRFWSEPGALPPQLRINRISATEGGTSPATFTVSLSRPSAQTVSVDYATADVTAHAGTDYQTTSGTLIFPPGTLQRTLSVSLIDNTVSRGGGVNLWFRVNLSDGVNATVVQQQGYDYQTDGRCTIIDDDRGYVATEPPLPDATVGVPYSVTFTALNLGNTPSWTIHDTRPPGLIMDSVTGTLSGIPTTPTIAGDPIFGYFFIDVVFGQSVQGREYHLTVRSDVIFANGFDPASAALSPLEPISTAQPARQHDATSFDPGIATTAAATHP